MKYDPNDRLYDLFTREVEIPRSLDERLAGCYEDVRRQSRKGAIMQSKHTKRYGKRGVRTALILAAAVCVLSVAALAVAHSGFFASVFGDGIPAREAQDVSYYGEDGSLDKTEHYPAFDRAPVDEEEADSLIGSYVSAIGQSVTLNGYTVTVRESVVDENGIGAVTIDAENPDGVKRAEDGDYPFLSFSVTQGEGDAALFADDRCYIDEAASTDTLLRYVCYFILNGAATDDITLHVRAWDSETMDTEIVDGETHEFPRYEEAALTLPAAEFVPVSGSFTDGEISASLSPVGLVLRGWDSASGETVEDKLVLRYADGSEYVVEDEDLVSFSVAFIRDDGTCFALNRLVDVENVTEIYVSGHRYGFADDSVTDFECTLTR